MKYLDVVRLDAIDAEVFQGREPFPWINPAGLLTEDGYETLHRTLPDLSLFEKVFDKPRKYGQKPHDRYVLEWKPGTPVPPPWREFVAELESERYAAFLRRLLRLESVERRFHWHYTPKGCSVSPHCDSKRKLGSHIFYFNRSGEWDPSWGGETLILDDGGRFHSDSHPDFDDFDKVEAGHGLDNHSLIFLRKGNSWHGVREIRCPENRMRKVFIVVFEKPALIERARRLLRKTSGGS
jgi:hypothetical protein